MYISIPLCYCFCDNLQGFVLIVLGDPFALYTRSTGIGISGVIQLAFSLFTPELREGIIKPFILVLFAFILN